MRKSLNKHTKLVVSALFVVIVILAVGITRFYLNVSRNTGSSNDSAEIVRKLDIDDAGNRIFEDASGMYGIVDSRDRIIVAPEWLELTFADGSSCIASKRIGGRLLTGCINYEGNITIPFIYRNVIRYKTEDFTFYIAESDSDGSFTIYDESFTPCFLQSWDDAVVTDEDITLTRGQGTYIHAIGESGFTRKKATISGQAGNTDFILNVYSRVILSKLNPTDLEKITAATGAYLEYAFSGNSTYLENKGIRSLAAFSELFPEETSITRKALNDITDIYIYSEKSETGTETYVVSVTVDADITYKNDSGSYEKFSGEYKAIIRFRDSASGIYAVSGSFTETVPEYPQDIPEESSGAPENTEAQYSA